MRERTSNGIPSEHIPSVIPPLCQLFRPASAMRFLVYSLCLLSVTAFHVVPRHSGRSVLIQHATKDNMSVTVKRAKDCVKHFGKYSVEEMEQLRAGKSTR